MNPLKPVTWFDHVMAILLLGDTRPVRFWLALLNIAFAAYMFDASDVNVEFAKQLATFPVPVSHFIWEGLFVVHAAALLRGLTGKYGFATLMIEGVLGWVIWTWTAVTHMAVQGYPGPTMICAAMMTWILIRYPTHWTTWGPRND